MVHATRKHRTRALPCPGSCRTGRSWLSGRAALGPWAGHDLGRVFSDLACAIADGALVISDFRVMGGQPELFGPVASVPTAWRG